MRCDARHRRVRDDAPPQGRPALRHVPVIFMTGSTTPNTSCAVCRPAGSTTWSSPSCRTSFWPASGASGERPLGPERARRARHDGAASCSRPTATGGSCGRRPRPGGCSRRRRGRAAPPCRAPRTTWLVTGADPARARPPTAGRCRPSPAAAWRSPSSAGWPKARCCSASPSRRLGREALLRERFQLTAREGADVLVWVSRGKSNRDIAEILSLSPRTVNKHLEVVFAKLGVENRASATFPRDAHALRAMKRGIGPPQAARRRGAAGARVPSAARAKRPTTRPGPASRRGRACVAAVVSSTIAAFLLGHLVHLVGGGGHFLQVHRLLAGAAGDLRHDPAHRADLRHDVLDARPDAVTRSTPSSTSPPRRR